MIVEYIRYKIDSEWQGHFVADYESAARSLVASEHCLAFELTSAPKIRPVSSCGSNGTPKRGT
jgi:hypothetical protein